VNNQDPTRPGPLADAARPAAAWWGERVRTVRPETDGLHPGLGDRGAYVALVGITLRTQQLDATRADEQTVAAFVDELARLVAAAPNDRMRLYVDYAPVRLLGAAADRAGLSDLRFPHKTYMTVRPDHVIARPGYNSRWRLVWSLPGWKRPPCQAEHYPEVGDEPVGSCALPRWHEGRHGWEQAGRT
jgi:hypothetical protein